MGELFNTITLDEARRLLQEYWTEPPVEEVDLFAAAGRRLAADIRVAEDIPAFDRSTVDGFAVFARSTFGASENLPAYLTLDGEIFMGCKPGPPLISYGARRIPTGGMLPPGADAVVMVEYSEEVDDRTIAVTRPVAPGENVIRRGEDLAAGEVAVAAGRFLRPQEIGLLAAAGVVRVPVFRRLRVGIISTGDEIVPPDQSPAYGQVRDVNTYALAAATVQAGGEAVSYGIVPDEEELLLRAARRAQEECDIIIISGGSSVGTRDMAARIIERLGRPGVLFHGLAIKPGKPTIGAVAGGKLVFGLPGHPVSALVVFSLLVAPVLRNGRYPLSVEERQAEFPLTAYLTRNLRSAAGREDFWRVRLLWRDGRWWAEPVLGKSGLISTLSRADGLAWVPAPLEGVEAGQAVQVKVEG